MKKILIISIIVLFVACLFISIVPPEKIGKGISDLFASLKKSTAKAETQEIGSVESILSRRDPFVPHRPQTQAQTQPRVQTKKIEKTQQVARATKSTEQPTTSAQLPKVTVKYQAEDYIREYPSQSERYTPQINESNEPMTKREAAYLATLNHSQHQTQPHYQTRLLNYGYSGYHGYGIRSGFYGYGGSYYGRGYGWNQGYAGYQGQTGQTTGQTVSKSSLAGPRRRR
jgi:hypothetical protein